MTCANGAAQFGGSEGRCLGPPRKTLPRTHKIVVANGKSIDGSIHLALVHLIVLVNIPICGGRRLRHIVGMTASPPLPTGRAGLAGSLVRGVCTALLAAVVPTATAAFQVLPKVSDVDRKLTSVSSNSMIDTVGQWMFGSALPLLKNPVHEAITLAALGCTAPAGLERDCVTPQAVAENRIVLYGVRWPDDPPFRLNASSPPRVANCDVKVTLRSTAQPKCWYGLFRDAGTQAARSFQKNPGVPAFGPGDYLLYRSHYGDLQFMHSMGTYDGETAGATSARMKMWARFLWGVATRQTPTDRYIRELGMPEIAGYFPGDQTVTNLLATGIVEVRKDLNQVAIGALLHMLQDSFSQAHAEREDESGGTCAGAPRPGRIMRFYSYARQDSALHDHQDTFDALGAHTIQHTANVVDVSRAFVDLWKRNASWNDAEQLFDCVFEVRDPAAPAAPGPFQAQR